MGRLSLLLRGMWWRRSLTLAVLIVAAVTTGVAALGPMYSRAAGESTLRDQLAGAGPADSGLHFEGTAVGMSAELLQHIVAEAPKPGSIGAYPRHIISAYGATTAEVTGRPTVKSAFLWRQGACSHVFILSGKCPTAAGQVLVSSRTVASKDYGWKLGGKVTTSFGVVTIVGTYRPKNTNDPFWFGETYFTAVVSTGNGLDEVDSLLAARPEFNSVPPSIQTKVDVDYPIDVNEVNLDGVHHLRTAVAKLQRSHLVGQSILPLQTNLQTVLDEAGHQSHLANVGVLLVTLQLGLLAWVVLFHVVGDACAARGNEVALAKLRGFRPWWTVRFGLAEPLFLMVLAAPLGLLLSWAVTGAIASSVLAPHTPVVLTWPAALGVLAGFAGGIVAATLAAYRTLTRPVLEQWRRTISRQHTTKLSLAIDVLIALVAGAGLVLLHFQHQGSGTVALLAPGLLVTAVALLGTRLLPVVARPLLPVTRGTKRIGLFLASRQVVRRPAGLRLAALLAVAVGLATFAVGGEAAASRNRTARAQSELGASKVVSIQYQDSAHDPVAQVRKADPDGRWAMPAATWLPDGGGSVVGTVLAVDSTRLRAIAYPASGGPTPATITHTIGAAAVPTVTITGTSIRATITGSKLSAHPAQIEFDLRAPRQPFFSVLSSPLQAGTHTYVAAVPCRGGCTFQGLSFNRYNTYLGPMNGTALLTALATRSGSAAWRPLDTHLTKAHAWRRGTQYGKSTTTATPTPNGVLATYRADNGGYGGIAYASTGSPIPALASPGGVATGPGVPNPPQMQDGVGDTTTFTVKQHVRVLPSVLAKGVMVDLSFIRTQLPGFDDESNWQVWLGAHAPSDAIAKLKAAGLIVQSVSTEHARVIVLGRQGPALALFLLLTCAIAAAALAVGATAISISASARRRSFEIAALRAVGVPRPGLYRAGVLEQLMLLGAAVVLGAPAGAIGARLAIPVIPEFADHTPILLRYTPPAVPILLVTAGFCALIVLAALLAARSVMRAARAGRLREAEE